MQIEYHRKIPVILFLCFLPAVVISQTTDQTQSEKQTETPVPEKVDVQPAAEDSAIQNRISGIMAATGWFTDTDVEVKDGVVFLRASTESDDYKYWAGELARNTQDVAAVVNQIEVTEPDIWNYEPAFTGLQELWRNVMRAVPLWVFGLSVLIIFWGFSYLVARIAKVYLRKRKMNNLLRDIISKGIAAVVFLVGLYIVFHVADLTRVALTVLGGTGLLGIILGIAFRDITENFLASIFLSIQNPFRAGDLVEINGQTGFIQRLTARATLMMTMDGNHMQIPNATVYKNDILNYTSNPNQRIKFIIGIGYDNSIAATQEIGIKLLHEHPVVLKEPEPWVLVDELASSTINMKFYFWIDGTTHNPFKVRSSVLRQVKSAFQEKGISMPDEAREIVFPEGVPVIKDDSTKVMKDRTETPVATRSYDDSRVTTGAEGQLKNNDDEIREQARKSRSPEEGEDLLKPQ